MTLAVNDWLYINTTDNKARFVLGVRGSNPLVCFGINPSTAHPDRLDPTVKRIQDFAHTNGFDSFIMLNVYPQRATKPKLMDTARDEVLHRENISQIKRILCDGNRTILAAWGTTITIRPYLIECLREIVHAVSGFPCHWVNLGDLTKEGHPRHPLYIKGDDPLRDFDIMGYVGINSPILI